MNAESWTLPDGSKIRCDESGPWEVYDCGEDCGHLVTCRDPEIMKIIEGHQEKGETMNETFHRFIREAAKAFQEKSQWIDFSEWESRDLLDPDQGEGS